MVRTPRTDFPPKLEPIRMAARRALGPIRPATENSQKEEGFLFDAKRTIAGNNLPAQHLVYFVLADLLGFRDLGHYEKVAWSIPIEFNGRDFLIEHRKLGVGVFALDPEKDETDAQQIVNYVHKAVKAARPFFDWLATKAVEESAVNVTNKSGSLYARFEFLRDSHLLKVREAESRENERSVKAGQTKSGEGWQLFAFPSMRLGTEATWLGLAAVEAFFSWTEHVLIHVGILCGKLASADEVTRAAEADWATKFKIAFDLVEPRSKRLYDDLIKVRKELRNFVAHGSFGKQGEAFSFHSSAGAVPVLLPDPIGSRRFSFGDHESINIQRALQSIEEFNAHLWEGPRAPARIYVQDYELPLILTMARDGTYKEAMTSVDEMTLFADHLASQFADAANMDW